MRKLVVLIMLGIAGTAQALDAPVPADASASHVATAAASAESVVLEERQARQQVGVYVLLYLLVFVGLAYLTVRMVWRDQQR